jgi:hypothetical protein
MELPYWCRFEMENDGAMVSRENVGAEAASTSGLHWTVRCALSSVVFDNLKFQPKELYLQCGTID